MVHHPGGELGQADYDPILSMHGQEASGVALVEFNDLPALKKILSTRTVACILAEPIMTNVGMVLPDEGYWAEVRRLCTATGTLLIIDETHTISSGPGGHFREIGLQSDALVLGKPVAGGIPAGVYGVTAELAERISAYFAKVGTTGRSGTSTTLAGSPLQLAMMRKVLETSFTRNAYAPMIAKAKELEAGIAATIAKYQAPWVVIRVGARVEFICRPDSAAQRCRGLEGDRPAARQFDSRLSDQSRGGDYPLPQYDAHQPLYDRRRCGEVSGGLLVLHAGIDGLGNCKIMRKLVSFLFVIAASLSCWRMPTGEVQLAIQNGRKPKKGKPYFRGVYTPRAPHLD